MPMGFDMEVNAQFLQKHHRAAELCRLFRCDQSMSGKILKGFSETGCPRDPHKDLQVPKTAGILFDVGFERVGGVTGPGMPLMHFEHLVAEKVARYQLHREFTLEFIEERTAPADKPRLQKRGADRDITCGSEALGHGSFCSAYGETEIPERCNKALNWRAFLFRQTRRHENEKIKVRVGEHFRAAVTADCNKRDAVRQGVCGKLPEYGAVCGSACGRKKLSAVMIAFECFDQLLPFCIEDTAVFGYHAHGN